MSILFPILISSVSAITNPNAVHPSYRGSTGTLHSISALPAYQSTFGVGATGHFFSDQPFIDTEKHSRNALRLSGNYWLFPDIEIYGGFGFVFNEHSNADSSRSSTSFFDSTDVGAKWVHPFLGDNSYFGVAGNLKFFSGTQSLRNTSGFSTDKGGSVLSFELLALQSFDFKNKWEKFPLRTHVNFGYRSPNGNLSPSSTLISDRSQQIEIFNLNAFKYHALIAQLGAEVPYRWVTPYVEYRGEMALFAGDDASFSNNRHHLGLGARINPHESFAILGGVEFGLGGKNAATTVGIPENMPWQAFFGVSFEAYGEKLFKSEAGVRGRVIHADTGGPLPDVEVKITGSPELPQLTNLSGFYELKGLTDGKYEIRFQKQNFQTQTQTVEIKNGKYAFLDIILEGLGPKKGNLVATLNDGTSGEPVSKAIVEITGLDRPLASDENGQVVAENIREGTQTIKVEANGYVPGEFTVEIFPKETLTQTFTLEREAEKLGVCFGRVTNADGTGLTAVFTAEDGSIQPFGTDPLTGDFRENLSVGNYQLRVQAENYLPQSVVCEVAPGAEFELQVTLEKPKAATLVENKIILPEAIFFGFDSAVIEQRSYDVLGQISEILLENMDRFEQLRIEGHTDSTGTEVYNLDLSRRRAESVRAYLIEKGIDANRLRALGFGESDPVATNLTEEGRAENRRVEFNLVRSSENGQ